jgi:hypothetical protein
MSMVVPPMLSFTVQEFVGYAPAFLIETFTQ